MLETRYLDGFGAQCSCLPVNVWPGRVVGAAVRRGSSVVPAFTALPLLAIFSGSGPILVVAGISLDPIPEQ